MSWLTIGLYVFLIFVAVVDVCLAITFCYVGYEIVAKLNQRLSLSFSDSYEPFPKLFMQFAILGIGVTRFTYMLCHDSPIVFVKTAIGYVIVIPT
jgi:hypothetical protein